MSFTGIAKKAILQKQCLLRSTYKCISPVKRKLFIPTWNQRIKETFKNMWTKVFPKATHTFISRWNCIVTLLVYCDFILLIFCKVPTKKFDGEMSSTHVMNVYYHTNIRSIISFSKTYHSNNKCIKIFIIQTIIIR